MELSGSPSRFAESAEASEGIAGGALPSAGFDPLNDEIPSPVVPRDPFAGKREWSLSEREEEIVVALAEAVAPAGHGLPGGGRGTLARLRKFMRGNSIDFQVAYRGLLWMVELSTVPRKGRPFSRLSQEERERHLDAWTDADTHASRSALRAAITPLKYAHFDDPSMFEHVGCRYETPKVEREELPRWLAQVTDGRELGGADAPEYELEAEVVVVGTGAGGAASAYELARRGRAVLMLEEGDYHRRSAFDGRAPNMTKLLYREKGVTIAWGNVGIPVWAGRMVGGTTAINSGTCYRTPGSVFADWQSRFGLSMITESEMSPYYDRVESMLQVAPARAEHLGGVGRVVERGARKLGLLHHGALRRNAPECDGQGICCFGCPTGAKRSTDVSYVPAALERGAQLLTAAKVTEVIIERGVARGVRGVLRNGRRFSVKAAAVVVSGGAFMTPMLLQASGVRSKWLGKNLSIHPATKVLALFEEHVDQSRGIPQGYAIEDFASEGIMLEGGSTPIDVTSVGVPWVGGRFMDLMKQFNQLATFGLMVKDTARGEVRRGPGGKPLITYNMNAHDLGRMQKGVGKLVELFMAAGAKRVFPFAAGAHEISSRAELDAFKRRKLRAGDIETTAFHPLGTCRLGADPRESVVGPDHECHQVGGLYVMDGSAIPSSLGVNPQLTIMAMALRASERLAAKLD
jgi:choline dehydrogenase-like flavoprotein